MVHETGSSVAQVHFLTPPLSLLIVSKSILYDLTPSLSTPLPALLRERQHLTQDSAPCSRGSRELNMTRCSAQCYSLKAPLWL